MHFFDISEMKNYRGRNLFAFEISDAGVINLSYGLRSLTGSFAGDGGPATAASLSSPKSTWVNTNVAAYIVDSGNLRIRKVDTSGIIKTLFGTGSSTANGDGGPAASASGQPTSIVGDSVGNLYFSDSSISGIRKIDTNLIVNVFAGGGTLGGSASSSDDNGVAATSAKVSTSCVAMDTNGNVYFTELTYHKIKKVSTSTFILTYVAGTGANASPDTSSRNGDGGQATAASVTSPFTLYVDSVSTLYFASQASGIIRKTSLLTGIVVTFAGGTGSSGYSGDGGPATSALLPSNTVGVAGDQYGRVYYSSGINHSVRVIDTSGIINRFAGKPSIPGYAGNGGEATAAILFGPYSIFASDTLLYICETSNNIVRSVVIATSTISTSISPSVAPTVVPSIAPTVVPSFVPTVVPSNEPSTEPSHYPSLSPSPDPSIVPSNAPTALPSVHPSQAPSITPSEVPSMVPTYSMAPSVVPSIAPTVIPTTAPTVAPSEGPTVAPSQAPTVMPSTKPSTAPSTEPTMSPSAVPTVGPSVKPSIVPTTAPSSAPTVTPSNAPSVEPTLQPSVIPTTVPTDAPTEIPSVVPSIVPTAAPTVDPSQAPSITPSEVPSMAPTYSMAPSVVPSIAPTVIPTTAPTVAPSEGPTVAPSQAPTVMPSTKPSTAPSTEPTTNPSLVPTVAPSVAPSPAPTLQPTLLPSVSPSVVPSCVPSVAPSTAPTVEPSLRPSVLPSVSPSVVPSCVPTVTPSTAPSCVPTVQPSVSPSCVPTIIPTLAPTVVPSTMPSVLPTIAPTLAPSEVPTLAPSAVPTEEPSTRPSCRPTLSPTLSPTVGPSTLPSVSPFVAPTLMPTVVPSIGPSTEPSVKPSSSRPSLKPSNRPTVKPSRASLTVTPSAVPSMSPTVSVVVISFNSGVLLTNVTASSLDTTSQSAVTSAVAVSMNVSADQVSYVSQTQVGATATRRQLRTGQVYEILVTVNVVASTTDFPDTVNQNGSYLYHRLTQSLMVAVDTDLFLLTVRKTSAALGAVPTLYVGDVNVTVSAYEDVTPGKEATDGDGDDSDLSVGEFAGIVVGIIVSFMVLAVCCYFGMFYRRYKDNSDYDKVIKRPFEGVDIRL